MKKKIMINGMSCGHCEKSVQNALQNVSGVSGVEVKLDGKCAMVTCEDFVKGDNLKNAVEDAGYEVTGMEDV
ncbi:MAG TPA: heavy metal transport/detoxification protein [Lachnospiraceae bacterium]|nr:cation transporter [uncultured Lachnoclostridium sp.]HAU85399.1 heavy metal transport/detoxification protein [Lachnospiraceae bacterium]